MANILNEFFQNLFRPSNTNTPSQSSVDSLSAKLDEVLTKLDKLQLEEDTTMTAIQDVQAAMSRLAQDVPNEIRALSDAIARQANEPNEQDLRQIATQANSLADRLEQSLSSVAQTTVNPTISGIDPTSGAPGSTVTITGSSFGTATGQVTFGGTPASVQNWNDTSITAVVPGNATDGTIQVVANGVKSNTQSFTLQQAPTAGAPATTGTAAPATTTPATGAPAPTPAASPAPTPAAAPAPTGTEGTAPTPGTGGTTT